MDEKAIRDACDKCAEAVIGKIFKPMDNALMALEKEKSTENAATLLTVAGEMYRAGWIDQNLYDHITQLCRCIALENAK